MGLTKILSHILVFTGPQFKILAKIDSNSFTSMHKTLIDWIIMTIGQHQTKGNKPKLKKSLIFFKALVPLLAGAVGHDALAIHAHMAEALEKTSVTVTKEKVWDHQRAFDKRVRPLTPLRLLSSIQAIVLTQLLASTSLTAHDSYVQGLAHRQGCPQAGGRRRRLSFTACLSDGGQSASGSQARANFGRRRGRRRRRGSVKGKEAQAQAQDEDAQVEGHGRRERGRGGRV